jgi:hypothetical protein
VLLPSPFIPAADLIVLWRLLLFALQFFSILRCCRRSKIKSILSFPEISLSVYRCDKRLFIDRIFHAPMSRRTQHSSNGIQKDREGDFEAAAAAAAACMSIERKKSYIRFKDVSAERRSL